MPFGCHKGKAISDLPDAYLSWLLGLEALREPLKSAVDAEFTRRTTPQKPPPTPDVVRQVAAEIVSAGYRTLALKHHPDAGGSHSRMVALNAANEWLRERIA